MYPTGTIMVYSGTAPLSWVIRADTCSSLSHVEIVAHVTYTDLHDAIPDKDWSGWWDRTLVFGSTTLSKVPCVIRGERIKGSQAHDVVRVITDYPGRIWVMQPKEALTRQEKRRLVEYLLAQLGKPYDRRGAALAGTRWVKWMPGFRTWAADRTRLYCVEKVEAALEASLFGRRLPPLDPGRDSPKTMVRKLVKSGLYEKPQRVK
jgi:hypothetical protein